METENTASPDSQPYGTLAVTILAGLVLAALLVIPSGSNASGFASRLSGRSPVFLDEPVEIKELGRP